MTKKKIVLFAGYIIIGLLSISMLCMFISVLAEPYNSSHDTTKAIAEFVADTDTSHTLVITNNFQDVFEESNPVDTMAINTAFLKKMREKGELLSSDEFASRITSYYNTLVTVLTALFVLFTFVTTIVTYVTIKNKFEEKFESKSNDLKNKANDLENKQRQKIVDELRSMLSDSKKIDEVIISAVGGHVEDFLDDLIPDMDSLATDLDEMKKKQEQLYQVVDELQEQVSMSVVVDEKETNPDDRPTKLVDETQSLNIDSDTKQNTIKKNGNKRNKEKNS